MAQSFKFHITEKKYVKNSSINKIIVSGWCISKTGNKVDYEVFLNGKKQEREIYRINNTEIASKNNMETDIGFRVIVDCEDIEAKEFLLFANDGNNKEAILKLLESNINLLVDNTEIESVITTYKYDKNTDMISLIGWAYSYDEENVNIDILDESGKIVEHNNQVINRLDLFQDHVITEKQIPCGFRISYKKDSAQKIKIKFYTKRHEKIVNISNLSLSLAQKGDFISKVANIRTVKKGIDYLKRYGFKQFIRRVRQGANGLSVIYPGWFDRNRIKVEALDEQRKIHFEYSPKISIIVATFNTKENYLKEMIDTVVNQSYSNWELCIADGSTDDSVEKYVKEHHGDDSRFKFKKLDKNYGISGNSNKALSLATGDYVGFYDHDDMLELDALYEIVKSMQEIRYDIVYTDEDKFDDARKAYCDPHFKTDFNLDLFRSHNYITHFFVVKKSILDKVGGFRSEYDGAQDYEIMFRCIEQAKSIHHVAKILYHWRMHPLSTAQDPESKIYCYEAGKHALEEHYKRIGLDAKVEMMPKPFYGMYHTIYPTPNNPLVSILIPNMNHKDVLKTCIDSLYEKNTYKNFEVIIIENNSTEDEIFEYYKELEAKHENIHVVYWKDEFNYSAINNFGVKYAKGEYLLFLNNDTEVISETAIREMLGCCMRDEVGIVGAKLLYEDETVQHCGVVIGFSGYAGHVFHGVRSYDPGYMCHAVINCNYSAVTAACLMTKKSLFNEVGGFETAYRVAGNDVDFCLKIRQLNKLVVYNAFSLWHHYESKSRGYEDTPEKIERFNREVALFQSRWPEILENGDPYYNKNFNIKLGPYVLE